jgi:hypothetical protein
VEVVCRFSVTVEAAEPVMLAVAPEQVGAEVAPVGPAVTVHASVIVPVNPPAGVSVMVEAPAAPGLAMVTAVPEMLSDGVTIASTLTWIAVEALTVPVESTPEMVSE